VFHLKSAIAPVPPATTLPTSLVEENSEHRIVTVDAAPADQVLIVHENQNPGWRATLNGHQLTTVRLDGWQQGWIVPAGQGGAIDLRFTPGNGYRLTLAIGFLLIILLMVIATTDRRMRRRLRRRRRSALVGESAAAFAAAETLGSGPGSAPVATPAPAAVVGAELREPPPPVTLREGRSAWLDAPLGVGAVLMIGGFWGLGALFGVLLAVRRQFTLRTVAAGFTALAGVGAAYSINADEKGFFGNLSIFSALVVVGCLVVGLDQAGGRMLTRVVNRLPPRVSEGNPRRTITSRLRAWGVRVWNATGTR
jgi:hypothetical protein